MKIRKRLRRAVLYFFVALSMFYVLAPFYYIVVSSLEPEVMIISGHWYFPSGATLSNFVNVFYGVANSQFFSVTSSIRIGFVHSIIISLVTMALTIAIAAPAAYVIARKQFRGRGTIAFSLWLTMLIPGMALIFALFRLSIVLHLYDTLEFVILAYLSYLIPFSVWLLVSYLRSIPVDLEQEAMVDGCSEFQALIRVLLPVARPGIVAVAIFAFISAWNEFLWPLILTSTNAIPLTVASAELIAPGTIPINLISAVAVVTVIPPIILAVIFQRYLVKGLAGGLKF